MPKDVILTPEGLANLKAELDHLSTTRRREVAARIKEAREFGDISENAEYDDAKNEQAMLEARIASLEDKLRSATVIDAVRPRHRPGAGRLGRPRQGRGREVHQVHDRRLGRGQPAEAKLSNESPVGKALIGRKRGEEVVFATPRGRAAAEDHQDRRRQVAGRLRLGRRESADVFADRRRKLERAARRRASTRSPTSSTASSRSRPCARPTRAGGG